MRIFLLLAGMLGAVACGGDDDVAPGVDGGRPRDASASDAPSSFDATTGRDGAAADGGTVGCPRAPAAADRTRYVVVAHPFAVGGGDGDLYEVLTLSEEGELSRPGTELHMGTGGSGVIAFTPDGRVGVVAQKDGTVGVFTLDDAGTPTVVEAAYSGAFYAASVVMDPSGAHAWVLDAQWRESGGGVYRLDLGCDGSVLGETLVAPAKLPYAMALRADGTALVVARDVVESTVGDDVHLLALGETAARAGVDVFADDEWIASSAALSANGRHLLVADNSEFSGLGTRVGVVALAGDTLSTVQTLSPIEDPYFVVASPFDDAALVVSGYGNALFALDYDPDAATPYAIRGELTYSGTRPQLPGAAVLIDRGTLAGLVLLAENVAVRRVRFAAGGSVTDLGAFGTPGPSAAVGAIGVTP